ncbi:hypothetical protein SAMN05192574_10930 [Mucilaginibacter gossypiicola]|uniref:Uncharacterized protein n=1 Tax=Mucilaginibacter gossypiicola TaxID=551995 RepID=A0A1H8QKH5_9SPHI|nr:hypothetical protein SAMN05192574_10930 [Mucilaginibacter gossypiicola]
MNKFNGPLVKNKAMFSASSDVGFIMLIIVHFITISVMTDYFVVVKGRVYQYRKHEAWATMF